MPYASLGERFNVVLFLPNKTEHWHECHQYNYNQYSGALEFFCEVEKRAIGTTLPHLIVGPPQPAV